MTTLQGKVAIVTGGSKGIGAAITRELASNGVKVAVNYNSSKESAEAIVKKLKTTAAKLLRFKLTCLM